MALVDAVSKQGLFLRFRRVSINALLALVWMLGVP